jgi:hypothetical protein
MVGAHLTANNNEIIRVFPRFNKWQPNDELAFVGLPPLFRPPDLPVRISVVFTWDIPVAERLRRAWGVYYNDVKIGGPAYGDPGGAFEPGKFIKDGVTITSRGCVRNCPFCFVPGREGKIRELEIKPGYIVQDNNLLGCSRGHIRKVFDMLRQQPKHAIFSGGIDVRLLKPWHADLFNSINIYEIWFACDSAEMLKPLEKAAEMFIHLKRWKKRCYTMIGFQGETIAQATARMQSVYDLGFTPFCQLYQGAEKLAYDLEWKNLQKRWSRPALQKRDNEINETIHKD